MNPFIILWTFYLLCGMCLCCKGGIIMAQISIEELYRGEGKGEKYGSGGIMGAVIKDLFANGIPDGYDGLFWMELLTVKHTLIAAEQMKQEGDFVSGMTDTEPLSLHKEGNSDDDT